MKTYFLSLKVIPTEENEHYNVVEGASANFWILENSPKNAFSKAVFYASKYDWKLTKIETPPVETTRINFIGRDIGLQNFDKAQKDGIAVVFVAWSTDGKTTLGPIKIRPSYNFNLNNFLKKIKQFKNKGRCLHYEAGERCQKIVKAHSIQKKGALSMIAHNGYVYRLTTDISILRKNKGRVSFQKKGINDVSTFLGFCRMHDNKLFEPIDNYPLIPTNQQVFLYGYRSLCRELFVKENSLNVMESQLNDIMDRKWIKNLFSNFRRGTALGLKDLRMHKSIYDNSLEKNLYQNIKYVLFTSIQKPFMAFSGLFCPDFDFIGRQLQDLGDHETTLELITFCSAPMKSGWGFLFSWHDSNSKVCDDFMASLATMISEKREIGDLLFRLVISNCENHAISPQWWENLPEQHKEQIIEKSSIGVSFFVNTPPSYLMEGLEGISNWKFENVITNVELSRQ
jgi:hypothetical protein